MSTEPHTCVITPNTKAYSLKSVEWSVNLYGLHWIVDDSDESKDRVIVPLGHDCIEIYSPMKADGTREVVRTYIPEVGVIEGSIPADRVVWLKDVIQESS